MTSKCCWRCRKTSGKTKIEDLAVEISASLQEYAGVVEEDMKDAVQKVSKSVRKEISEKAPKNTGHYSKSWRVKKVSESSGSIHMTVYSKDRAYLAHLLENGHGLRNGGRVEGRPHIAQAEENGRKLLEELIKKTLS